MPANPHSSPLRRALSLLAGILRPYPREDVSMDGELSLVNKEEVWVSELPNGHVMLEEHLFQISVIEKILLLDLDC